MEDTMSETDKATKVKCPNCGTEFPLTDAITEPLRNELEGSLKQQYDKQLVEAKEVLEKEFSAKAKKQAESQVQELQEQVKELSGELKEAKGNEAELRKLKRTLEREKEDLELQVSRKVDEQTEKAKKELEDKYSLKETQHKEQIESLNKQIGELKRKAEQGSQQAQGEALERKLEDLLKEAFPYDLIEPVPKGISGADVIQRVNGKSGQCCGTIVWESKNTKNWSKPWIDKLKENQREIKAEIAVLASVILPNEITSFGFYEGIWVTHWSFACQLACALRISLIEMQESKIAQVGKDHKMELLYDYLISPQFKQRVETVVGAFSRMRKDLADERQSMERIWSKREKQIELVIKGTAGLYGDMQGIAGSVIPEIEALQMPYQLESGDAEDK